MAHLIPALSVIPNQTLTQGIAVNFQLPESTGGNNPITYSLTGLSNSGLAYDPSDRRVSGTPSVIGSYSLTYTATDNDGDTASRTFSMTIEPSGVMIEVSADFTVGEPVFEAEVSITPRALLPIGGIFVDRTSVESGETVDLLSPPAVNDYRQVVSLRVSGSTNDLRVGLQSGYQFTSSVLDDTFWVVLDDQGVILESFPWDDSRYGPSQVSSGLARLQNYISWAQRVGIQLTVAVYDDTLAPESSEARWGSFRWG